MATGLAYPLDLDAARNFALASPEDLVKSAIAITLLTPIGSRPMFRDFGSEVHKLRFMNINDPATQALAVTTITESIETWVPEVEIADLVLTADNEDLTVDLQYVDLRSLGQQLKFMTIILPVGGP